MLYHGTYICFLYYYYYYCNRLMVVSDITCDINGSIEFLDRTCTIANPFFQYNPLTREEVCADIGDKGITVMGQYL